MVRESYVYGYKVYLARQRTRAKPNGGKAQNRETFWISHAHM